MASLPAQGKLNAGGMQRITLLGAPRVDGSGGPITGPAARGRHLAVLALLARAGAAGVARERITALLWPESDGERARHSLEQVVYVLRRALGSGAIASAGSALVLESSLVESDVGDFVAAADAGEWERAAALYAGPFLDAFHVSGTPDFERWVDEARAELHRRHVAVLTRIAERLASSGDHRGAAETWRRLVAAEPLSATAVLGLMRSLDASGERSAALAAARAHEERLRDDLDAAPDPEVARTAAEFRRSAPLEEAASTVRQPPSVPPRESESSAQHRAGRRGIREAAVAFGALIVLALLASVIGGSSPGSETAAADAGAAPRVIVAPFTAEAGDSIPANAGRMAADWIRQGLARTGLVDVASATGGGASRGGDDVRVAGRVYQIGDSLWFQAWIATGADGAVLRTMDPVHAPAEHPVAALEPLRQQVLGAIATLYDPRLAEWAGVALRPPSYPAYRAFVRGMEAFSAEDLRRALDEFRRAATLDSGYAQARLWGAWSCVMLDEWRCADSLARAIPNPESLSPVEQAWRDRITALLRGDTEASFQAARRLVRLSPGSGWTMALHNAAMDTRRGSLALAVLEEVGPGGLGLVGPYYWASMARAHHMLGDHPAALAVVEEGIRAGDRSPATMVALAQSLGALGDTARLHAAIADADALPGLTGVDRASVVFTGAVELRAHGLGAAAAPLLDDAADRHAAALDRAPGDRRALNGLVLALHEAGRWNELERVVARHADELPEVDRLGIAGHAAVRRGDAAAADSAEQALARQDEPFLFGSNTLWLGRIAAARGEPDRAMALLRQAVREGLAGVTWHRLHYGSDFEPLRGRRDYRELMRPRE